MFSISKEYAPPFEMITPFFKIGVLFYLAGVIFLLFLDPGSSYSDMNIIGWTHWFLLGFIMMIIFGAMAQLVPVVVEVGHFSVDLYLVIWPLLMAGTIIMSTGFIFLPAVLPYGGLLVLTAMIIFLYDTSMTLRRVEHISLTVKTVAVANLFLLSGIVTGFVMSLAIGEGIGVDVNKWLGVHAVLVLGGYVTLTIMGLSLILLPMFGLSHGFDETPINRAFKLMIAGVLGYFFSSLFGISWGNILFLLVMFASVSFYLQQIIIIYKTRARKENDIWAKSMFFGYGSLFFALILGILWLFIDAQKLLLGSAWFLIMGFFTFLINGHLYKIIPFLVWFKRYSPLVGKERVPMLHEMYPKREAEYEFIFSAAGVTIAGMGILFGSATLFKAGVSFLIIGAGFMFYSVAWMINYGKNKE
ncbi:MAG: hypothetical protein LT067_07545 [Sulfurovum sp.]|nr:hypothetical protein [Sulfurovum sp.]